MGLRDPCSFRGTFSVCDRRYLPSGVDRSLNSARIQTNPSRELIFYFFYFFYFLSLFYNIWPFYIDFYVQENHWQASAGVAARFIFIVTSLFVTNVRGQQSVTVLARTDSFFLHTLPGWLPALSVTHVCVHDFSLGKKGRNRSVNDLQCI